jgi:hypothetical protein
MADLVTILNTIRANGSVEYLNRVPLATRTNLEEVGAPIIDYTPMANEFLSAIVNKIAMQVVHSKIAKNPLAVLKKGTMPLGADIEEIFTNMAVGETFDPTGANLLTRVLPDTQTLYHRINRNGQYAVTISKPQLQTAFTSYSKLEEFLSTIINTLYSGDNYDEFILMKNLIADAVINGEIVTSKVPAIVSSATAGTFIKNVRNSVAYFQFPSSKFNKYREVQLAANPAWTGKPITTWTPKEDQILLIRADIMTEIDVDVLAHAFNMEKTSLLSRIIEVDTFGAAPDVYAVLCDKSLFQVYDKLNEMSEFYNPKGLYWTYYWTHFQIYSISLFANAIAFIHDDINITAFDAIDNVDAGKAGDLKYANAAAVKAALPKFVSANNGALFVPVTSWTDTDNYADVAASYTFTAVLGTLPRGVTNTGSKGITVEVVVGAA